MKKKNVGIIASLIALKSKVFGAPSLAVALYGPPKIYMVEYWLKLLQTILAPIIFLIGTIIYLKKSKSDKRRKIITTIIIILLFSVIYYGIEFLLYYLNKPLPY